MPHMTGSGGHGKPTGEEPTGEKPTDGSKMLLLIFGKKTPCFQSVSSLELCSVLCLALS